MTDFAIVGTGFVSDFYGQTTANHPGIRLKGVFDLDRERARIFAEQFKCLIYDGLDQLLSDPDIRIVANLTDPRNHYEVSRRCLAAGKHVYSEKPMGMTREQALELKKIAASHNAQLTSAPCTHLSDSLLAMRRLIDEGAIGKVRLAYAEMDDGMVHKLRFRNWTNSLGISWPYRDEFEVGCTYEHAGYQLAMLTALFGPASHLTSFASVQVDDKLPEEPAYAPPPDFTTGILEFDHGICARLTCSVLAPEKRSLTVVGDDGWIEMADCWDFHSPLRLGKWRQGLWSRASRRLMNVQPSKRIKTAPRGKVQWPKTHRIDFARGIAHFAEAIEQGRPPAMTADMAIHIVELTEKLSTPTGCHRQPLAPLAD